MSTVLNVLKLAYIIVITPIVNTIKLKLKETSGNKGKINLNIPYKLNFKTIPASTILPAKGDSTCAFNNQLFKKIVGVFTAKAINIPQNKKICVVYSKVHLNKTSKYVVPAIADIVNIDSNKNNDPNNVYKKR